MNFLTQWTQRKALKVKPEPLKQGTKTIIIQTAAVRELGMRYAGRIQLL